MEFKGDVKFNDDYLPVQGLLELCGMYDLEGKPMLLCSVNDNSVRLYDLPS